MHGYGIFSNNIAILLGVRHQFKTIMLRKRKRRRKRRHLLKIL
jgi:hypothetical protein